MISSSTGERSTPPPQTRQPFVSATIDSIPSIENSTSQKTSITSAVPAGDVTAREEVFGIVSPASVTIETTIGVTQLPATPPIECLSATTGASHVSCWPASAIARVRCFVSESDRPFV